MYIQFIRSKLVFNVWLLLFICFPNFLLDDTGIYSTQLDIPGAGVIPSADCMALTRAVTP